MKIKYFMRGLGVGLIIATVLLFMMYSYKMSDPRIISRAKQLGMIFGEEETETTFRKESTKTDGENEKTDSAQTESMQEETTNESLILETTESTETTAATEATQATENPETAVTEPQTVVVEEPQTTFGDSGERKITIVSGMGSKEISELLQALEIIDSADNFDNYLIERGLESSMQNGEYMMRAHMSYEEVADILTR